MFCNIGQASFWVFVLERWKSHTVFGILVILNVVRNFHGYILFPLVGIIVRDFRITYGLAGIMLGLYVLLSAFAELLWSFLSDVRGIGRRLLIFAGVALSGVFTVFCYYARSFFVFSLFYIFGGMSLAVVAPFSVTIIGDIYRRGERTQKLMLLEILGGIGLGLGFGVSLASNAYLNTWRESLLILLLVNLSASVLIFFSPEPPKGLAEEEISDIVLKYGYPFRLRREDLALIARTQSNKYIVLQGLFGTVANGALQLWLVQYLVVEAGFSETAASIFLALGSIGAFPGFLLAKLADRLYEKKPHHKPLMAAVCSVIEGFFFIAFFLVPLKVNIKTQDFVEASISIIHLLPQSKYSALAVLSFLLAMIFNSPVGSIRDSAITDTNLPEFRATIRSGADIAETFTKGIGMSIAGIAVDLTGNLRGILITTMIFWFFSAFYWLRLTSVYDNDVSFVKEELVRRKENIKHMHSQV